VIDRIDRIGESAQASPPNAAIATQRGPTASRRSGSLDVAFMVTSSGVGGTIRR
jgi:hypothetical protein